MKVDGLGACTDVGRDGWNRLLLEVEHPSVFLTWEWQTAWADAFVDGRPLTILRVTEDGGSLAGLLPLYEERPGRHAIVGGVDVSDYLDLIAPAGREEPVWRALLQHRVGDPSEWDLHGIRCASATATILPEIAPSWGLRAQVEREERSPVLRLPATWEEYLARLRGHDRHELRRKMRRLERELPGAAVRSVTDPGMWDAALSAFLALHRLSRPGKARFMDQRMEGFFRRATRALADAGWARLWFLEHDGVPLASYLCLEYGHAVGLYNSGFDPQRARLAPGIVLLAHVIRDAIERGLPTFDFLRGEEPYKYAFGPVPEDLLHIRVTP